jgi:hypothetical protein
MRPGKRLTLVPEAQEVRLQAMMKPALDRYLRVVGRALPRLRATFLQCEASRRFTWSEANHSVVAGMLMDLSLDRMLPARFRETAPGEASFSAWAFERSRANNSFGVQMVSDEAGDWTFAQLWHCRSTRPALRIDSGLVTALARLATGRGGSQPEGAARPLLKLRYFKLAQGAGGACEPRFPAFAAEEWRRLSSAVAEHAVALRDTAVLSFLDGLAGDRFWSEPGRLHAAVRLMLESATDRVVDAGLLPPFPAGDDPAAWGRWMWQGDTHKDRSGPRDDERRREA